MNLYAMGVYLDNAIFTASNEEFVVCSESATVCFVLESSELSAHLPCYSIVDKHLHSLSVLLLGCKGDLVQYKGNRHQAYPS